MHRRAGQSLTGSCPTVTRTLCGKSEAERPKLTYMTSGPSRAWPGPVPPSTSALRIACAKTACRWRRTCTAMAPCRTFSLTLRSCCLWPSSPQAAARRARGQAAQAQLGTRYLPSLKAGTPCRLPRPTWERPCCVAGHAQHVPNFPPPPLPSPSLLSSEQIPTGSFKPLRTRKGQKLQVKGLLSRLE